MNAPAGRDTPPEAQSDMHSGMPADAESADPLLTESPVLSPCLGVCTMNPAIDLCEGCLRTLDEIARWSSIDDAARRRIKLALRERRRASVQPSSGAAR